MKILRCEVHDSQHSMKKTAKQKKHTNLLIVRGVYFQLSTTQKLQKPKTKNIKEYPNNQTKKITFLAKKGVERQR